MTLPTPARTWPAAVVLALVAGLPAGCTSGSEAERSPAEVLTEARRTLDETSGVHIVLATEELPPATTGVLRADGVGTHAPAFEGDLKVQASGITADVEVVAVDGVVYAELPFTTDFSEVDPGDYGAPDPADLMRTEDGLSSLLTETEDPRAGEKVREGELVLTEYTGTLPGEVVARIIPSADADGTFEATYTVSDDDVLDTAAITGPFYPDVEDVTYTISFDDYGSDPEITAP